jgi:hypothetical protein
MSTIGVFGWIVKFYSGPSRWSSAERGNDQKQI